MKDWKKDAKDFGSTKIISQNELLNQQKQIIKKFNEEDV